MKDLLNKLKAAFDENTIPLTHRLKSMKSDIEGELALLDLGEKLDADFSWEYYSDYIRLTNNIALSLFVEGCGKEISWPDDGKQPSPGWYLAISFPCGAYTLDKDYPVESFNKFFEELKSFGAKHVDTVNHCLYFTLDKNPEPARKVYKAYNDIFKKYYDMGKEEVLQAKITKAEEELRKLKGISMSAYQGGKIKAIDYEDVKQHYKLGIEL